MLAYIGGEVLEKDVVPGKEVPFGGRETKLEHTIQYNIRLLEAVRTQRRTMIEREKYVENQM